MGESLVQGLKNLLDAVSAQVEQMNLSNNLRDNDGFNKAYDKARLGVLGLQVGFEALEGSSDPPEDIPPQDTIEEDEESTTMDDVPVQIPEEVILPEKQNDAEPSPMGGGPLI